MTSLGIDPASSGLLLRDLARAPKPRLLLSQMPPSPRDLCCGSISRPLSPTIPLVDQSAYHLYPQSLPEITDDLSWLHNDEAELRAAYRGAMFRDHVDQAVKLPIPPASSEALPARENSGAGKTLPHDAHVISLLSEDGDGAEDDSLDPASDSVSTQGASQEKKEQQPKPPLPTIKPPMKKKDPNQLYSIEWECPICAERLGEHPGMIPMVSASCGPAAHVICQTCLASLQPKINSSGGRYVVCPQCNEPASQWITLRVFVNETEDSVAAQTLSTMKSAFERPAKRKLDSAHAPNAPVQQRAQPAGARQQPMSHDERVQLRVDYVVSRVTEELAEGCLERYPQGVAIWGDQVPEWDRDAVHLTRSVRNRLSENAAFELRSELSAMARALQPYLDELYAETRYSVQMAERQVVNPDRQTARPKNAYLVFYIAYRNRGVR